MARRSPLRPIAETLYRQGMRVEDIANHLGCASVSIHFWARKLGWGRVATPPKKQSERQVARKKWTDEGRTLFAAGVPISEIASALKLGVRTVLQQANEQGWAHPCARCGCAITEIKRQQCAPCRAASNRDRIVNRKRAMLADPTRRAAIRAYENARVAKIKAGERLSRLAVVACKKAERLARRTLRSVIGRYGPERTTARVLVEKLRLERPDVWRRCKGKPYITQVWHAKYQLDPTFRAREIERTRARKAARSGIVMRSDGSLTGRVVHGLFASAKRCPQCGRAMDSLDKSLDHITPLAHGGTHSLLNVRVICKRCNTRKGATRPEQLTLGAA